MTEVVSARPSPPAVPERATAVPEATVVMGQTGGLGTRLVGASGPYSGQSFPLTHASVTLGRSAECGIALPADTLVSRRQAEIRYADGRHHIQDVGSANGTRVNGERLAGSHALSTGDLIQMGDTSLRYE